MNEKYKTYAMFAGMAIGFGGILSCAKLMHYSFEEDLYEPKIITEEKKQKYIKNSAATLFLIPLGAGICTIALLSKSDDDSKEDKLVKKLNENQNEN